MVKQIAIGVDIGGSHVSCAAYNLENKDLLPHTMSKNDLDNHATPDVIIERWGLAIRDTIDKAGHENIGGIGFAMPGPYDYEKGVSQFTGQNGKYENTYGMNVPLMIRECLELDDDVKVRFINDASAFAIGEDQVGKAKDYSRSLAITLGTGFGSAFVRDSMPVVEGDEVPESGCLWHLPFEEAIADDYFSTRGLCERYNLQSEKKVKDVKEIADLADIGSKNAKAIFTDFGTKLGLFLKPWCDKFEVEALVIGGNISRAFSLFEKELAAALAAEQSGLNISVSELKESASFIGSATLIDDNFYKRILPAIRKM